jgi:hypothetical protein
MAMHELPHGSPFKQCDLLRFKWVKRLNMDAQRAHKKGGAATQLSAAPGRPQGRAPLHYSVEEFPVRVVAIKP